jgi:exonuclease VII small subunit
MKIEILENNMKNFESTIKNLESTIKNLESIVKNLEKNNHQQRMRINDLE